MLVEGFIPSSPQKFPFRNTEAINSLKYGSNSLAHSLLIPQSRKKRVVRHHQYKCHTIHLGFLPVFALHQFFNLFHNSFKRPGTKESSTWPNFFARQGHNQGNFKLHNSAIRGIISMERREYLLTPIVVNKRKITKVIIDSHYEIKHREHINDQKIISLVQLLDQSTSLPDKENGLYEYYVSQLHHDSKVFRLIWRLEKDKNYVGVINAFRTNKGK